jgi:hypothetical protein
MNDSDQIDELQNKIDKLIDTYISEFDLPLASMVGILQIKIHELIENSMYDEEDEEDEEDEDEI